MQRFLRRRTLWLLLLTLLMVGAGPYLVSRIRSGARAVQNYDNQEASEATWGPASPAIRIGSYNIAHGRGPTDDNWQGNAHEKRDRIETISQLLNDSDLDVVVLNEVDFDSTWSGHQNQAEAIAKAAGYPHWIEQRNFDFRFVYGSWKFGNAILSRYPIVAVDSVRLPPASDWEDWLAGSKQGVVCTLQLNDSRQVRVMAVHLEHRDEATRIAAAKQIIALAESSEIPLIAAGDFNSSPSGFPESQHDASGDNALDLLISSKQFQVTPLAGPLPAQRTFSATKPVQVIDWIMFPRSWKQVEYEVLDSQLSDHRPVVAVIEVN